MSDLVRGNIRVLVRLSERVVESDNTRLACSTRSRDSVNVVESVFVLRAV